MPLRTILGVLAYAVPTFALGFLWHLRWFTGYYHRLEIYRAAVIVPFGFVAIVVQGLFVAWLYPRAVDDPASLAAGFRFAAGAAVLSWTFTTLAVGAKNRMTSVPAFLRIETAFTVVQYLLVAPLLALAHRY
ncbi:MAG: hypothetical protein AB7L66_19680 [Gemmatimonadales bacterium]